MQERCLSKANAQTICAVMFGVFQCGSDRFLLYSLDLAPSNFYLFPKLKKVVYGVRFGFNGEVEKVEVTIFIAFRTFNYLRKGIPDVR